MDDLIDPPAALAARTDDLVRAFEAIARTRMAGLPLLNPALGIEALGFEALPAEPGTAEAAPAAALGVLVTPWFMNLVVLPLQAADSDAGVGRVRTRVLRGQPFEFIGAYEPSLGAFEACFLFSPMFEFVHAAAARDTAREVLALLREPVVAAVPATSATSMPARPGTPGDAPAPARRSFLFGRGHAAAARR